MLLPTSSIASDMPLAAQVHVPELSKLSYRLRYLNDDGTELPEEPALRRGAGKIGFTWSLVGLTQTVWENAHSLPPEFIVPVWETLRLDAVAALPNVGTAVVLAATALEVFIAQVLNQLAAKSTLSGDLWNWLSDRGNFLKDPGVDEQFDILLHVLAGHSLKEDQDLWNAFLNLKKARNSFVHAGIAEIRGKTVDSAEAAVLVNGAGRIIQKIRRWLPAECQ